MHDEVLLEIRLEGKVLTADVLEDSVTVVDVFEGVVVVVDVFEDVVVLDSAVMVLDTCRLDALEYFHRGS